MPEYPNTYDSVYPAITDVTTDHMDNLVLAFGNSRDNTFNAVAFQIVRAVRRTERVENLVTLADNGTQDPVWIGENGLSTSANPGKEVFEIRSARDKTLVEYGFAVPQDGVYVGIQDGDGAPVNGLRPGNERARGFGADDLPTYGGVLSDHTYVSTPSYTGTLDEPVPTTALSESHDHGVFRIDSEENGPNRFFFMFNNQSGAQVDVDLTAIGTTYDIRPIEDTDRTKEMLAGNGYDRRVVQYGGFDNTNPNLPRGWNDYVAQVGPGELAP